MPLPFKDIDDQSNFTNFTPTFGTTAPTNNETDVRGTRPTQSAFGALRTSGRRRQRRDIAEAIGSGTPEIPFQEVPFDLTQPDRGEFGTRITEDLLRQSREGLGREFGRASFILGGTPISEEFNLAQRGVREQGAIQSASGSGFAEQRVRELEIGKQKALSQLRLGIESKNEQARQAALDELTAIEEQNRQFQRGLENQRRLEQLQGAQRVAELQRGFTIAEREGGGGLFGAITSFGLNLALPGIGRSLAGG